MRIINYYKALTLLVALFVSVELFAKTDVELQRTNFWGNAAIMAPLTESGIGIFAMYSHRYNHDAEKKVDGTKKDQDNFESFLQEFFFGPTFSKKMTGDLSYHGRLMYRGQYWYSSEAADMKSFYRHTVDWHNNFFYNVGAVKLHLRANIWNWLPVEDKDAGVNYDYEIINRYMLGVIIPIGKMVSILIHEEVFLNLMPSEKSSPGGNNFFFRNAIWAGVDIKPVEMLSLSLKYVNYHSMGETSAQKKTVDDHYLYAQAAMTLDFLRKKK